MRLSIVLVLLISLISATVNAQAVEIVMKEKEVKKGATIHFGVKVVSEQDLEIAVFSKEHLISHQKATLNPIETAFDIDAKDAPARKYVILITGNDIHLEEDFIIK